VGDFSLHPHERYLREKPNFLVEKKSFPFSCRFNRNFINLTNENTFTFFPSPTIIHLIILNVNSNFHNSLNSIYGINPSHFWCSFVWANTEWWFFIFNLSAHTHVCWMRFTLTALHLLLINFKANPFQRLRCLSFVEFNLSRYANSTSFSQIGNCKVFFHSFLSFLRRTKHKTL
jgi:hypothetical protein